MRTCHVLQHAQRHEHTRCERATMCSVAFPLSTPHLPPAPFRPLHIHALQSRSQRYLHLSQVCQEHRTGVSETLRCHDFTLQIIPRDLFRKTGSERSSQRVNYEFVPSFLLPDDLSSAVSLKSSRMPSSPQLTLGKDVVRSPMKRLPRQRSG